MRAVTGLLALIIAIAPNGADGPIVSHDAEVAFHDGSLVRMRVLQDHVRVQTRYGILTVPFADIRRIEFGLHVDEPDAARSLQCLKALASNEYKARETASRELFRLGHLALPALRSAKSPDLEASARVAAALDRLGKTLAPELLALQENDRIDTDDVTIVGKILEYEPGHLTIRATCHHFGEHALPLSALRSMHLRVGTAKEHVLDAERFGVGGLTWADSGIIVHPGTRLRFTASGSVDLWAQGPGQYVTGPKGFSMTGVGGKFPAGALIARVGEKGEPFFVGERAEMRRDAEGRLYLQILPSSWNAPSIGKYTVRIEILGAEAMVLK